MDRRGQGRVHAVRAEREHRPLRREEGGGAQGILRAAWPSRWLRLPRRGRRRAARERGRVQRRPEDPVLAAAGYRVDDPRIYINARVGGAPVFSLHIRRTVPCLWHAVNHEEDEELDDGEILHRINALYREASLSQALGRWKHRDMEMIRFGECSRIRR